MRSLFPLRLLAVLFYTLPASILATGLVRAAPPSLTYFFPAGAQQGKTVEISAGGTFARWPVQAWTNRKGVAIKPAKDKGKFAVTIASDAVPGVCWIRLHDEQGASELRPFFIGTVPEMMETEPNDAAAKPQVLAALPVAVNGRLGKSGDVDCFAVRLRKGETLVAALEANRTLGSPLDGVLQLLSADGFVLEENNDDCGLDPRIVFTAPKDGVYVVRAFAFPAEPDAGIQFAGGETYIYRLTLTTGGFADRAFPLAARRGESATIEIRGWNIPNEAKTRTVKAANLGPLALWHPRLANALPLLVEPHRCLVESEPNDRKKPQAIEMPATISGHIDPPGDLDVFAFAAKKGQRLSFRLDARSAGSQLDPLLRLTDTSGKRLAQADDATAGKPGSRDTALTFTVPQDGSYRLEVSDQNGHGGQRHFYRLRATLAEPDYALTLTTDRFTLAAGKPLAIPLAIDRRDGFDRAIEISVEGLPDGVTAKPVQSTGAAGKSATLNLEAKRGPVSGAFRIVGRVAGQADFTRTATAPAGKFPRTTHLWLTATK